MAAFNKFKDTVKKRRMQQRLDKVINAFEEPDSENESIKKATEIVIRLIEENPNMPAIDLLKKIQEEENLPNKILVESAKQLPEIRSETAAVKAVEELDISPNGIQEILEHVDVSPDAAEKMVRQIQDEKIKEEEMKKVLEQKRLAREEKKRKEEELKKQQTESFKKQLKSMYVNCDKENTFEMVSEFNDILNVNDSEELQRIIIQILARKSAIECKQFGTTRISTMTKAIPADKLLEKDFPKIVKEEFEDIKDVKEYPGNKVYSEDLLKKQLLSEIARNVANDYKEMGVINIPQSDVMSKISDEQEMFFVDQLETFDVEIEDKDKLHRRIRGKNEYSEDDLISLFRKMSEDDKEDFMKLTMEIIQKKQSKFDLETEKNIMELRKEMEGLSPEELNNIINDTRDRVEELKNKKKEKEEEEER